jgi:hypothetical protein
MLWRSVVEENMRSPRYVVEEHMRSPRYVVEEHIRSPRYVVEFAFFNIIILYSVL